METVVPMRGHNISDHRSICSNYCVYCKYNVNNVNIITYRFLRIKRQVNIILYIVYEGIIGLKICKKHQGLVSETVLPSNVNMNFKGTELYRFD